MSQVLVRLKECPILDDVRNFVPCPLKSLISRAKDGIELDRDPGTYTQITDPRGRMVAAIEKVQNSVTPQMAVDMVARYEAGASIREVAAAFNVHRETAARHLRASGTQLRKAGLTEEQAARAEALGPCPARRSHRWARSSASRRERSAGVSESVMWSFACHWSARMARPEACR